MLLLGALMLKCPQAPFGLREIKTYQDQNNTTLPRNEGAILDSHN